MSRTAEVSLIMTVLNEESGIVEFLDSIASQSVIPAEIVIVDGGSQDGTVNALRSWTRPAGCSLVVEVLAGAGISQGRNRAIELASHARVLVADGGTTLDGRWVEHMLAAFPDDGSTAVVGGFFRPTGDSVVERAIAFAVTPMLDEIEPEHFLPSSRSLGFSRDAWSRAGGYPEWLDYCEDLVFDLRMKKLGVPFRFAPEAIVTWAARPSIRGFMKQYYRYARGDGKASLWAKRHAARYGAYVGGAGLFAFGFVTPWSWLVMALGFAAYQRKFVRRVWRRRAEIPMPIRTLALVPVVVVSGDVAKMAGYPAGLIWRAKHGRTRADY